MFLCVSPNPAIDKRLRLSSLRPGAVNRATDAQPEPGGKAAHVAMVLQALGAAPLWIGFSGGAAGRELLDKLREIGIEAQPVPMAGSTRTNLEIVDDHALVTEILEPGSPVSSAEVSAFLDECERLFAKGKSAARVILSGSLPPGAPRDLHAGIAARARSHGCSVWLDTSGEPLRAALAQLPTFVKPNREEAEWLTGERIQDVRSAAAAVKRLLLLGARSAAVSLGQDGLVWTPGAGGAVFHALPPPVTGRSTVGCGDATVAAFAWSDAQGLSEEDTLRWAAACGAANCLADSPGRVRLSDVRAILREVRVEKILCSE